MIFELFTFNTSSRRLLKNVNVEGAPAVVGVAAAWY